MAATALGAELVADLLQQHGEARMRANGTSMLPSIRPGDIVVIERAAIYEIPPGAIAFWRRGEQLVAHRVTERTADGSGNLQLVTRGDRQQHCDEPIAAAQLLGRVTWVIRGAYTILLEPEPSLGARLLRFISRFTDWPAALLVLCTRGR
jgi:signal peptidase I